MTSAALEMKLLSSNDPQPVQWVNATSKAPVLLICEHAGRAIPQSLGDLGLPRSAIDSHLGWDIGAEALARKMAEKLESPLVIQSYSRLVIDCNRPPQSATAIPNTSDNTLIPGNIGISQEERAARVREIFIPMHVAMQKGLNDHPRRAAFSIHSFSPALANGPSRPWHAGFLTRRDLASSQGIIRYIQKIDSSLALAINEPYQIEEESDWFVPVFAEPLGISHSLIEIRNDLLLSDAGIERWASLLVGAIQSVLETNICN